MKPFKGSYTASLALPALPPSLASLALPALPALPGSPCSPWSLFLGFPGLLGDLYVPQNNQKGQGGRLYKAKGLISVDKGLPGAAFGDPWKRPQRPFKGAL